MAKKSYARFLSRKSIVSLIGIDYDILEETGFDNYGKFLLSGFLVILILVISFASVFYAFDLMFDMWHAEILLSLFFGLTFFNIYIFLIQTFSKEVFPTSVQFKFFNLSNLSRIAFVLFIGFLIAQPLKIFVIRHQLDLQIETYKAHLVEEFSRKNAAVYTSDLRKLYNSKAHFTSLGQNATVMYQLIKIDHEIQEINEKIENANLNAKDKISGSNFLTKRILYARHYITSLFIEGLVLLIFCTPIFLIYTISEGSKYYQLKKERDRKHVIKHYLSFKEQYQKIFEDKHQLEGVTFYEPYQDPPFNTIRKLASTYANQNDFFLKYLK